MPIDSIEGPRTNCYGKPEIKFASFLFPVMPDGQIYVGQRVKDPHAGKWGAVGGKSDPRNINGVWDQPSYKTTLGGARVMRVGDVIAQHLGVEFPSQTSAREVAEELFHGKKLSEGDITDIVRLGSVVDIDSTGREHHCYVHVGRINRDDVRLKPGELEGFKPLTEINPNDLYPISKISLFELQERLKLFGDTGFKPYNSSELLAQIPDFELPEYMVTSMMLARTRGIEERRVP